MKEILTFFENQGIALVLTAGIFIFVYKYGTKWMDLLIETQMSKRQEYDPVPQFQASREVQARIDSVRRELSAERLLVWEFHNGTRSVGGVHFIKMSNTFESDGAGVFPAAQMTADIWTSHYSDFIMRLIENDYIILDENTDKETPAFYGLVKSMGDSQSLDIKIIDSNEHVIGFVSIRKKQEITDIDISRSKSLALELAGLLTVSKQQEKEAEDKKKGKLKP